MPYQSLYRRYRPQRFAELRGQDHVSRTLRNAVRDGRVAHSYLLSGPRGTGKTSSARILAKALNCAAPADGEPCGVCESCVEVASGTSLDVHELDAASNNGVEAMRDLVARAALGTPGRWKVYIVDEVHMLSAAASNALLKTLEEPPGHVVFVLATTDPQKVLPTIRSRTQHFEFRLLPADLLAEHLRWVAADAGLEVAPEAIDLVARRGNGSVRDALSALDLVAAAGGIDEQGVPVDEIVEGLCERDAGRALVGVAERVAAGQDPRQLARDLIEHLRNTFLATMAPRLAGLPDDETSRLAEQARRLGAPATVRAMENLGEALVDMRESPDPRVTLEVALVRLCRPDADTSPAALVERIERLERAADGGTHAPAVAEARSAVRKAAKAPPPPPPTSPPPPPSPPPSPPSKSANRRPPAPGSAARPESPPGSGPGDGNLPTRDELTLAWGDRVLDQLSPRAKALYKPGRFTEVDGAAAVYALPNKVHVQRCERVRSDVEDALAAEFGRPVPLRLIIDETPSTPPTDPVEDIAIDAEELRDATPAAVASPMDHVMQAFEGAEVVEE
ncbi:MAG: DNA polymerase III subunit gamma/tau [Acidimicrobiia bacterium]|nr:DNA polymerase III subunit gamma/tau [Acidimicrobiia bacterium]